LVPPYIAQPCHGLLKLHGGRRREARGEGDYNRVVRMDKRPPAGAGAVRGPLFDRSAGRRARRPV
jgi:hypothetical protein